MEKNMNVNFEFLERRVLDALDKTDLEYIRYELKKLDKPSIASGVGGSSVVSEFTSKVIREKNGIITVNSEPRDFGYNRFNGFNNVVYCSYSGNNYGIDLSFNNALKHYLLSNNSFDDKDVTYLKYDTSIDKERSFISLGATLIPISVILNYYLNGDNTILEELLQDYFYSFKVSDIYEIFTGLDTSTSSKYLESTLVESGIGIPIIHDKYSFCHGRSTSILNHKAIAIYLDRGTNLDKLLLEELKPYYEDIVVISSNYQDHIIADYEMLIKCMYLTRYIAKEKQKDLSKVEYNPIVKKLYKYNAGV